MKKNKGASHLKRLLILLPLLFLPLAGCGGGAVSSYSGVQPASTNTPTAVPHHKVGDTVTIPGQWQITIQDAKIVPGMPGAEPLQAGDVFLVFDARLKNLAPASQDAYVNPYYLRGTDGMAYSGIALDGMLNGPVTPGGLALGKISFEILPNAHTFLLTYAPVSAILATWDISV